MVTLEVPVVVTVAAVGVIVPIVVATVQLLRGLLLCWLMQWLQLNLVAVAVPVIAANTAAVMVNVAVCAVTISIAAALLRRIY